LFRKRPISSNDRKFKELKNKLANFGEISASFPNVPPPPLFGQFNLLDLSENDIGNIKEDFFQLKLINYLPVSHSSHA